MATKKKAVGAAGTGIKTSARMASLTYVLGVVLLVLGTAFLMSLAAGSGSKALALMQTALLGLCGQAYFVFPFMLLWLGAALIAHAYHGVSARNLTLAFCVYFCILSIVTMLTFVSGKGNLMEYIYVANQQKAVSAPASFFSYIQRVYHWGVNGQLQLCGGGALSMLFAYPVYKLFGVIGGIVFLFVLLIGLVMALTRLSLTKLFRSASDGMEKRRLNRIQQRQEEAGKTRQPAAEARPMEQAVQYGQRVQMETTYDSAPAWQKTTASHDAVQSQPARPTNGYQPSQHPSYRSQQAAQGEPYTSAEGFYPVNNGGTLYDERFVLHPEQMQSAAENEAGQVVRADTPEERPQEYPARENAFQRPSAPVQPADSSQPKAPEKPSYAAPYVQEAGTALKSYEWQNVIDATPITKEEQPKEAKNAVHRSPARQPAVQKAVACQPVDDAPPWEEQLKRKEQTNTANTNQSLSDWQQQLRTKQQELSRGNGREKDSKPRPVFTDPAVPLTGERVAISPSAQAPREENRSTRMDGTPKVRRAETSTPVIDYMPPPFTYLSEGKSWTERPDTTLEDTQRAQQIERTLSTFNIACQMREITHGPAITRFAIKLAEGIKVRQVIGVLDNIALDMGSDRVRVEAPIPGTSYVGIEVPNSKVSTVTLREVLDSAEMHKISSPLVVALGKDIAGHPIVGDLSKMPHLLIAGATGSGKSVCINSIVCSILYRASPAQVRMIMVDPKQVELQVYNGIPHLLTPVVSDPKKAAAALNWVVVEMLERYSKFSARNVRNLEGFNKKVEGTDEVMPHIVVIIDEMADLMDTCRKDVEESVRRLAALARAAGIYMVLATQRPSVDVITGVIKNNIPSRIAFTVSSGVDSRTIIDTTGAEKLMGKGDMLYQPVGASKPTRVQGCFVSDDEVTQITDYIRAHYDADYNPSIKEHMEQQQEQEDINPMDDDGGIEPTDSQFSALLQEAIRMAVEDGQTSISMLQRRLRVGYARAGRLIDEMTKRGIITESEGSKPRKTKITREQYLEMMRDDE